MICEQCGNVLREGTRMCDQCGSLIQTSSGEKTVNNMRQGRPDALYGSRAGSATPPAPPTPMMSDASIAERRRYRNAQASGRPSDRRGVPDQPSAHAKAPVRKEQKTVRVRKVMINWTLVFTVLTGLLILAALAGYVYLLRTDEGQLIMARLGRDASSTAIWALGTEQLDKGYIEKSIETYEKAYEQEPDREDIYEKLKLLAEAYEANAQPALAEAIYTKMYTDMEPTNPFAYRAIIRLLQSQNRQLELSDFLQVAYDKTGDGSFRKQREQMLPSIPTASLESATYEISIKVASINDAYKTVELYSAEDYDVYYILGEEGTLPEDGTLYTEPLKLYEGGHIVRAVAVSSDLISDELSLKYTISLPRPEAPKCNLAPNTYERQQKVIIRYPGDDPVTIYYTIDSQSPTANSPIFTGDPIVLPGGKTVFIKAVAVNKFGKVSNEMSVQVQINIGFKNYFKLGDEFNDFTLMTTTRDAFTKKYGSPLSEKEVEDDAMPDTCVSLQYSWGEARFYIGEKGYILYYISTTSSSMSAPRKTKVGMKEKDLTALFRDMGQLNDQNGDRSLYFDESANSFGKLYRLDDINDRISYSYKRTDGAITTLTYYMENDTVARIEMGVKK